MAYGGGTFITHNKALPGAYANYVSGGRSAFVMSDRGVVALPLYIDWGPEGAVFEVSKREIMQDSVRIFGYPYLAPQMMPLRELVQADVKTVKVFRLTGTTTKATCKPGSTVFATARYGGSRGNALKLEIERNIDDATLWNVKTLMGNDVLEVQSGVANAAALQDNAWVVFNKTATLAVTAATAFTGGAQQATPNSAHQQAQEAFGVSGIDFNSLICPSGDPATVASYVSYTKMWRDDFGKKFLLAAYHANEDVGTKANYLGVTSVNSAVQNLPDEYAALDSAGAWSAVYWVGGRLGATPLTKGLEGNANAYNGELDIFADMRPAEMERAIKNGQVVFHRTDDGTRVVLKDINSKVTDTDAEGEEYRLNQVVRVCDQIAMDVSVLFDNRKLGSSPNDIEGRNILRTDIIEYLRDMERLRIIQQFDPDTVEVLPGEQKPDVIVNLNGINITAFMLKLYMTIYTI